MGASALLTSGPLVTITGTANNVDYYQKAMSLFKGTMIRKSEGYKEQMKALALERERAILSAGRRRAEGIALERAIENARVMAGLFNCTAEATNSAMGGPVELFPFIGTKGDIVHTLEDLQNAGKNLLMTTALILEEYLGNKEADIKEREMQRATLDRINEFRKKHNEPEFKPVKTFTTEEFIASMTETQDEKEEREYAEKSASSEAGDLEDEIDDSSALVPREAVADFSGLTMEWA